MRQSTITRLRNQIADVLIRLDRQETALQAALARVDGALEQVAAERADERRKVIEELAREAEAGMPAGFVRTIRWSEADDAPVDTLSAWLGEHSKGGESATIGTEEEG